MITEKTEKVVIRKGEVVENLADMESIFGMKLREKERNKQKREEEAVSKGSTLIVLPGLSRLPCSFCLTNV